MINTGGIIDFFKTKILLSIFFKIRIDKRNSQTKNENPTGHGLGRRCYKLTNKNENPASMLHCSSKPQLSHTEDQFATDAEYQKLLSRINLGHALGSNEAVQSM